MAEIKPAEVSAILRQELAGYESEAVLEEVGTILQIGDGIARIYGMNNAEANELVEFEKNGIKAIFFLNRFHLLRRLVLPKHHFCGIARKHIK